MYVDMTVMKCIKRLDMQYYIEAIDTFELGGLIEVNAINEEDAVLLLTDMEKYNIIKEEIEKIDKVAKALKKEKEEIDEKMKAIVKRLKEVVNRDIFNFGMPKSEEEINRIIIDNINRYRERHSRDRVSSSGSGSNEFNVYADIKRNSGIR